MQNKIYEGYFYVPNVKYYSGEFYVTYFTGPIKILICHLFACKLIMKRRLICVAEGAFIY